ncbi:PIR Superfamily Protein [Plasmodium ovale wallikeri]|uniref:PIR Superfamily Protein n=1 Tax=Plasmodium ovale wallikeri TaxID=864142 RepID=A0A1A9ALB2_PLAOA|nr:PIR Superfamily Protein [Plasmodium ovale wallikeri]
METRETDYDIFENLIVYFQNEDLIEDNNFTHNATFCYVQENENFKSNYQLTKLCEKFVKFFEKLKSLYKDDATQYHKYREYLNYWLTYKLMTIAFPKKDKPEFFQIIQNNCDNVAPDGELKDKIYQIKEKDFENMDIIYILYRIYYELKSYNDVKCKEFHTKYEKYYNLAVNKCYTNDEKLCIPLKKFTNFYNNNRYSKLHVCSTEGLPEIPKFVTPKSSEGMEFIDKLAHYLHKLSSKQTSETLPIISNTKYPNLVKLLSLNYNLLLYSNEQKKRDNMMEILHEFIKFCKDKNTISVLDSLIEKFFNSFYEKNKGSVSFLNLFIMEFFRDFYQKEKVEYELIYDECYNNTSKKSYCSKYKMCNEILGKDLHKIRNNIKPYLEYKEKPAQQLVPQLIQSLSSQYSSSETPLDVEDENNSSSNSTPTNVGVGVGALLTLSFLYKFTPLGSWVNRTFLGRGNTMYNYEEENDQDFLDHNSGFDNYISENNRFNVAYGAS